MDKSVNFSLVLGGPLYQFFLRTRLARQPLELLHRRMIAFPLVTWVPPFLLSMAAGTAFGGVTVPFIQDITTHARLLLALPLFIAAELLVHERLMPIVQQFIERDIIPPSAQTRFQEIITSAMRLRNSIGIEVILLLCCFTVGHTVWGQGLPSTTDAWYATKGSTGLVLTYAGHWYSWISIPVFQFILLRWYFRWFIWARFLWQVARLPIRILPAHPDRSGGLGFLADVTAVFAPILVAQGAVLGGIIAGKIFFEGASLVSFKLDILAIAAFFPSVVLAPLCVFAPKMAVAKRKGKKEYGALASRYVDEFDHKWNTKPSGSGEAILGSSDIQSLADMGNSYTVLNEMRVVPFGKQAVLHVILATLLPILPLILTIVPIDQLIDKLLNILL